MFQQPINLPLIYYVPSGSDLLSSGRFALREPYLLDIPGLPSFTIPTKINDEPFLSDFASVPRFLRYFYDRIDFGYIAPIVHDYLCEVHGATSSEYSFSSKEVHDLFNEIMKYERVPNFRRRIAHLSVLLFGPRW